jgi:hypothetical protein
LPSPVDGGYDGRCDIGGYFEPRCRSVVVLKFVERAPIPPNYPAISRFAAIEFASKRRRPAPDRGANHFCKSASAQQELLLREINPHNHYRLPTHKSECSDKPESELPLEPMSLADSLQLAARLEKNANREDSPGLLDWGGAFRPVRLPCSADDGSNALYLHAQRSVRRILFHLLA